MPKSAKERSSISRLPLSHYAVRKPLIATSGRGSEITSQASARSASRVATGCLIRDSLGRKKWMPAVEASKTALSAFAAGAVAKSKPAVKSVVKSDDALEFSSSAAQQAVQQAPERDSEAAVHWVQCERCSKWRISVAKAAQDESFFCEMQPGFDCRTKEDDSWFETWAFADEKSPNLKRCLLCLEQLAFKVPECGYKATCGPATRGGWENTVQGSVVDLVRECKGRTVAEVAAVMRKVYSRIKKTCMYFDWAPEYEQSWLGNIAEATSAKDLYDAGALLEEFGIDWNLLLALDDFLKTLVSIDSDWLDADSIKFVRNVLPQQLQCTGRGSATSKVATSWMTGSNGLPSLLCQLCDALVGRSPQPLSKRDFPTKRAAHSAKIVAHPVKAGLKKRVKRELQQETAYETVSAVAAVAECAEHDAYQQYYLDASDEEECKLMTSEQLQAAGRFAERVEAVLKASQELWRDAKPNRGGDVMKWRLLVHELQQAIHLRSGVLPEAEQAFGYADVLEPSLQQLSCGEISDDDIGDIEEVQEGTLGSATVADLHAAHVALRGKSQEAQPLPPSPRLVADTAVAARCSHRNSCNSLPCLDEQQLLDCERQCGLPARAVLEALGLVRKWQASLVNCESDCSADCIVAEHQHESQAEGVAGVAGGSAGQRMAWRFGAAILTALGDAMQAESTTKDALVCSTKALETSIEAVVDADAAYVAAVQEYEVGEMDRLFDVREASLQSLGTQLQRLRCQFLAGYISHSSDAVQQTRSASASGATQTENPAKAPPPLRASEPLSAQTRCASACGAPQTECLASASARAVAPLRDSGRLSAFLRWPASEQTGGINSEVRRASLQEDNADRRVRQRVADTDAADTDAWQAASHYSEGMVARQEASACNTERCRLSLSLAVTPEQQGVPAASTTTHLCCPSTAVSGVWGGWGGMSRSEGGGGMLRSEATSAATQAELQRGQDTEVLVQTPGRVKKEEEEGGCVFQENDDGGGDVVEELYDCLFSEDDVE